MHWLIISLITFESTRKHGKARTEVLKQKRNTHTHTHTHTQRAHSTTNKQKQIETITIKQYIFNWIQPV